MDPADRITILAAVAALCATLTGTSCSTNARLDALNTRIDDVNIRIDELREDIRGLRDDIRELRALVIDDTRVETPADN